MRLHMIANPASVGEWDRYVDAEFVFSDYPPGARVLDVGFGQGTQMARLAARGCRAVGIECDASLAERAAKRGLQVIQARAEYLPFASGSFDGLVCEVVIPYTDEAQAIAEIGRVLRPGGVAKLSYHGLGYALRNLMTERPWKQRFYSVRVIVNTWLYAVACRRLPGFLGDTLYQSRARLRRYYRQAGLELLEERARTSFAGAPVFIYHSIRRRDVDRVSQT